MSEELPELPETVAGYKASFVRDYARRAVLAERERAAQIAQSYATCGCNGVHGRCTEDDQPLAIAAAIRKGAEDRLAQSLEGLKHTPISPASTPLFEQLRSRKDGLKGE